MTFYFKCLIHTSIQTCILIYIFICIADKTSISISKVPLNGVSAILIQTTSMCIFSLIANKMSRKLLWKVSERQTYNNNSKSSSLYIFIVYHSKLHILYHYYIFDQLFRPSSKEKDYFSCSLQTELKT